MKIAVLPGDGIGKEIVAETIGVLGRLGLKFEFEEAPVGGAGYDRGDIGQRLLGREWIYPHPQFYFRSIAIGAQIVADHRACDAESWFGHAVFEVEHQRVGA